MDEIHGLVVAHIMRQRHSKRRRLADPTVAIQKKMRADVQVLLDVVEVHELKLQLIKTPKIGPGRGHSVIPRQPRLLIDAGHAYEHFHSFRKPHQFMKRVKFSPDEFDQFFDDLQPQVPLLQSETYKYTPKSRLFLFLQWFNEGGTVDDFQENHVWFSFNTYVKRLRDQLIEAEVLRSEVEYPQAAECEELASMNPDGFKHCWGIVDGTLTQGTHEGASHHGESNCGKKGNGAHHTVIVDVTAKIRGFNTGAKGSSNDTGGWQRTEYYLQAKEKGWIQDGGSLVVDGGYLGDAVLGSDVPLARPYTLSELAHARGQHRRGMKQHNKDLRRLRWVVEWVIGLCKKWGAVGTQFLGREEQLGPLMELALLVTARIMRVRDMYVDPSRFAKAAFSDYEAAVGKALTRMRKANARKLARLDEFDFDYYSPLLA